MGAAFSPSPRNGSGRRRASGHSALSRSGRPRQIHPPRGRDLPAERGLDVSYETVRRWVSGRMFSARTALRPRLDPWVGATYPSQELPKKTLAEAAARRLAADRLGKVANADPKSLADLIRLV